MRKQFNPEAKHLTLTNVKANPEIQSLSQNPHVSNPVGVLLFLSYTPQKSIKYMITNGRGKAGSRCFNSNTT